MQNCSYSVKDLLPHAPPMVLLDEIVGWDRGRAAASVTIHSGSRFFIPDKGVPAYVGLEYMAQTCGIYAGIEARNHGLPVRLGFLLGTRNFHARLDWFEAGDRLMIEVSEIFREETMAAFDCRIMRNEEEVASAQLNLYQPEESETANE